MDCHSTFRLFCLPHSTKVLPTASSVTVFQLAENQTLNTPDPGLAAAAAGGGAGAPGGAAAGGLAHAANARPINPAFRVRKCLRENPVGLRGSESMGPP